MTTYMEVFLWCAPEITKKILLLEDSYDSYALSRMLFWELLGLLLTAMAVHVFILH